MCSVAHVSAQSAVRSDGHVSTLAAIGRLYAFRAVMRKRPVRPGRRRDDEETPPGWRSERDAVNWLGGEQPGADRRCSQGTGRNTEKGADALPGGAVER